MKSLRPWLSAAALLLLLTSTWAEPGASDPIFWAAIANDVALAKRYVADGGSLNIVDKHGKTPLMYAAARGNADITAFLLESGAAPDATTPEGASVLEMATGDEVLELLRLALARATTDERLTEH